VFGIPDLKLRGVYAYGEPTRAGGDVVAGQRRRAGAVEGAVGGERQRVRRDHHAPVESLADGRFQ
jgi:hypothetical protein